MSTKHVVFQQQQKNTKHLFFFDSAPMSEVYQKCRMFVST